MKMNITFWVSSIPNQRMVKGISTATGMLRRNTEIGPVNASKMRYAPARTPSGTPTTIASPKPVMTRRSVAAVLATSARSVNSVGMLRRTSPGLGSTTGDTIRVSGVEPNVMRNHTSTARPTPTMPTARFTRGGGGSRSVNMRRSNDACATGPGAEAGAGVVG
jgi:hypothetical protein